MRPWLFTLALVLCACGSGDTLPSTPLGREKFVQVLTGSLLIEARLGHEMAVDHRMDSPIQHYYEDLFREQGVTQADFKTTYDIYAAHPQELKAVYEEVLVRLQQKEDVGHAKADSTAAH
ncbi:MAG TPA: DUF4296 domain-containing protein [Flavobacteriales bacterium]|jgi:hypothetical protein|nr:DUF4296 domain-containing protein [Flavobacteriales bacterium]